MQEFIDIASRLADEAGKIVHRYYRQPFDIMTKDDESPVTIADRTIEQRMREIIENERPDDGIYGEEFGIKDSKNGLTWVLDPIDGTKPFIIGRPTFGTLIALCEDDAPILGVIDQAILKERWIGAKDIATTFNSKPVKTRPCPLLDNAFICSTTPAMFRDTGPVYENFEKGCTLIWGGDCYMYGLMANGMLDIAIEANMQPYDYLAHVPIIEGAGGFISDFQGKPLTLKSSGEVIALGDAALWDQVKNLLK